MLYKLSIFHFTKKVISKVIVHIEIGHFETKLWQVYFATTQGLGAMMVNESMAIGVVPHSLRMKLL